MWFAAKLLFEATGRDEAGRVLQEESVRLIKANDESEALSKATNLGIAEQHQYANEQGETVAWHFVSILEIQDLCEGNVFDGMEVFSILKWSSASPDPMCGTNDSVQHSKHEEASPKEKDDRSGQANPSCVLEIEHLAQN